MKRWMLFILIFSFTAAFSQNEDYEITINGEKIKIDIGKEIVYKNQKGESVKLLLTQNDTLKYADDFVEFKYLKGYSDSKTKIDDSISQVTVLRANGNGYIVQEYGSLNPSKLTDLMLDEISKESVNYGY